MRLAVAIMLACPLLSGAHAAGQESAQNYRIRPSEVGIPAGVKLGDYQRITRPFENWILICDEDLQSRTKVCNVSQTIEDASGNLVFSWSLAATKEGKPYMILRTALDADPDGLVSLKFDGRDKPVDIHIDGCNELVCIGMLPVGPIMREQISKNAAPTISYPTADGDIISVTATLKGLSSAVEAIN